MTQPSKRALEEKDADRDFRRPRKLDLPASESPVNEPSERAQEPVEAKIVKSTSQEELIASFKERLVRGTELRREAYREVKNRGYTALEFKICGSFLPKRGFERPSFSPPSGKIAKQYPQFKKYLDQIRDTRGYGLTTHRPFVEDDAANVTQPTIVCIFNDWSYEPQVRAYVKRMEEMVVAKCGEEMGKPYKSEGLVNLVRCNYFTYLVTFLVHEEGTDPFDVQPPEIAEACFQMFSRIRPENMELYECKIRKGEEVLFSTAEICSGDWN